MSKISYIFPVHNEALILEKQITNFVKIAQTISKDFEIILIENGSTDATPFLLKKLRHQYSKLRLKQILDTSYGQAIRTGLLAAKGRFIFILNIDFFDKNFIEKSLELLSIADIVVGSKTLQASLDKRPLYRRLLTYFFNALLRLILNFQGTDTHGLKGLKNTSLLKKTIRKCRSRHELFDTELIIRLTRSRALLIELPLEIQEIRPSRYSELSRMKRTFFDLVTALSSKYLSLDLYINTTTADDFGLNPTVCKKILAAYKNKVVNKISILANFVKKEDLVALKKQVRPKHLSFHVNFVTGKAVTPKKLLPTLTNRDNRFYPLPVFFLKLCLGLIRLNELELEATNQLLRLIKFGIRPSALDSEQHTHTFRLVAPTVHHLAKKYDFSIRSRWSTYHYFWERKKLIKLGAFFCLQLVDFICSRSHSNSTNNASINFYHSRIVHPGTNFD